MRSILLSSTTSAALRVMMIIMEFAVAAFLARALGAEDYGVYVFFYSLVKLASIPITAGLPTFAVRTTAYYLASKDWGLLRGFLVRANEFVIGFSTALILLALAVYLALDLVKQSQTIWALLLVPVMALGNLRGGVLRGMQQVVLGQLPENILRPALLLIGLIFTQLILEIDLQSNSALAIHFGAAVLAVITGSIFLIQTLPIEVKRARAEYRTIEWGKAVLPFSMIAGVQVVNSEIGVILLRFLGENTAQIGLFQIAVQASLVVSLPITALNMVLSPRFAQHHRLGEYESITTIARFASLLSLVTGGLISIGLIVLGPWLLPFAFGSTFSASYPAMLVLIAGQIVNCSTGSLFPLLKMLGHEHIFVSVFIGTTVLTVMIDLLTIPSFGIIGVASATAIGNVTLNLFLLLFAWWKLDINPLPALPHTCWKN